MFFNYDLEISYFTMFFFLVAISSFFFLGNIISSVKNLHPFLKKHNALSRTISIAIVMGLSRLICIPFQQLLEYGIGTKFEYDEIDVLQSFFWGKTMAITFLIIYLYLSK